MRPSITSETYAPDALLAGSNVLPVTRDITLLTGENRKRGALLGRVTASGKYKLSVAAAEDGSEVPRAVLAEDTDATAADVKVPVYEAGEFNAAALTLGAGHTVDSIRDGLRDLGIHLKSVVPA